MKKLICLFGAIVLCAVFISCNTAENHEESSVSNSASEQITEPQKEPERIITVADLSQFVIVRGMESSDDVGACAQKLQNSIKEKLSLNLTMKSDFVMAGNPAYSEAEFEILLGVCDRDECAPALEELKYYDYTYRISEKKLLICAVSDRALQNAVDHFIANVIENADTAPESVFFSNDNNAYLYNHDYPFDDIKLMGASISEYKLIYPADNKYKESIVATTVRGRIRELTGYDLQIEKDSKQKDASGREIHIGVTDRDTDFAAALELETHAGFVGSNGKNHWLLMSNTPVGIVYAADRFISTLKENTSLDVAELNSDIGIVKPEASEKLAVMSYNIQMWAPWTAGKPEATMKIIQERNPDLFGVQEATLPQWGEFLKNQFGETYGIVDLALHGIEQADWPVTENPIFYRKDKFELIESGFKWLTDTPDVNSKLEVSAAIRTFTYAVLERKSDGLRFVYVNTHLDHVDGQPTQAAILVKFLERFEGYPIIVTGDFNFEVLSAGYTNMTNGGYLSSKFFCEETINSEIGTAPSGREVDYCYSNGRNIFFHTYEVISNPMPSDHYALYIEFSFCK